MKKKSGEVLRIKSILKNDRLNNEDEFCKMLLKDLDDLLKDYFDYKGVPELSIAKSGSCLKVDFYITANRIKSFSKVP